MYRVFTRNWWKLNPSWPNGLEPNPKARKSYHHVEFRTEQEAVDYCQKWNATHKPGRLSNKAEFERA